jgi:hypothetical protein
MGMVFLFVASRIRISDGHKIIKGNSLSIRVSKTVIIIKLKFVFLRRRYLAPFLNFQQKSSNPPIPYYMFSHNVPHRASKFKEPLQNISIEAIKNAIISIINDKGCIEKCRDLQKILIFRSIFITSRFFDFILFSALPGKDI